MGEAAEDCWAVVAAAGETSMRGLCTVVAAAVAVPAAAGET